MVLKMLPNCNNYEKVTSYYDFYAFIIKLNDMNYNLLTTDNDKQLKTLFPLFEEIKFYNGYKCGSSFMQLDDFTPYHKNLSILKERQMSWDEFV